MRGVIKCCVATDGAAIVRIVVERGVSGNGAAIVRTVIKRGVSGNGAVVVERTAVERRVSGDGAVADVRIAVERRVSGHGAVAVVRIAIESGVSADGAVVYRSVIKRGVAGDGAAGVVVSIVVERGVSGDGAGVAVVRSAVERGVSGDGKRNCDIVGVAAGIIKRKVHNRRRTAAVGVARCTQDNAITASGQGRRLRGEIIARPPVAERVPIGIYSTVEIQSCHLFSPNYFLTGGAGGTNNFSRPTFTSEPSNSRTLASA